jgi:hypothetical protein
MQAKRAPFVVNAVKEGKGTSDTMQEPKPTKI